jgi:hypothetical protein
MHVCLPEHTIGDLTAKLAEAERERDEARRMYIGREGLITAKMGKIDELRAEVARLAKRQCACEWDDKVKKFSVQCKAHAMIIDAAEARLTALREAVEASPCHDFCRWQQTRHEIPYGTHHPAYWKVAALANSGEP